MKITLLQTISGMRDGEEWPPRGSVVDFPDDEAAQLVSAGIAAEGSVELPKPGPLTGSSLAPETAAVADDGVETADAAPAAKGRARKVADA